MFSGLGSSTKPMKWPRIRRFERSNLDLPFYFHVFFNLSNLIGKFDNNLCCFLAKFFYLLQFWGSIFFLNSKFSSMHNKFHP